MLSHSANGWWKGDFWEHIAVVRELSTHPNSPLHPRFLLSAPHEFFSPYAVAAAWIVRTLGTSPVVTLAGLGIFNLALFFGSFRLFCTLLLGNRAAPFYALLFTLLLWGITPWEYSGFYHLGALGYVLPYPSTFAMALLFLVLSLQILQLRSGNFLFLALLSPLVPLVLLVHPMTALVMGLWMLVLPINRRTSRLTAHYSVLAGIFTLAVLVSAVWPWFPFMSLILDKAAVFHEGNQPIYSELIKRVFPALFGVPLVLSRIRANWKDPLGLMFLGLCLIYTYGGVTGKWTYGRVISHVVLVLHLVMADWITRQGPALRTAPIWTRRVLRLAIADLLLVSCLNFLPVFGRSILGSGRGYTEYGFLSTHTQQYDVILSDIHTSWIVPAFGGKVVASHHPQGFVEDYKARRQDLETFFSTCGSHGERLAIIDKYKVHFLLVNEDEVTLSPEMERSFGDFGETVYHEGKLRLIRVSAQ